MFDEQEQHEHELAPDLLALERHLRELKPATPRVDRDRLMYAAGHAARLRPGWPGYIAGPSRHSESSLATWAGRWFWPAATATMTAATLLLAATLVWQKQANFVAPQGTTGPAAATIASVSPGSEIEPADQPAVREPWSIGFSADSGYLGVRYTALTRGVGAISPEFESSSGDHDSPASKSRVKPATMRGLIDELLPASKRSDPSRS
jgi:hypothetical protein